MRGLLDQLPQEQQKQMRRQRMGAAIADGMMAYGGVQPFASQGVADQVTGLLEEQQAQQRQAANQQVLDQYAQQGLLQPHQQALLATNPDLMEHYFKERYTGRSIAPGAALTFGGEEQYRAPNRPQSVGTDLIDPDTGKLIHRAPQAPGVNVNVGGDEGPQFGPIPAGHTLMQTPEGAWTMAPIPGSPAAREVEADERAQQLRDTQSARAGGTVVQDANRLLNVLSSAGPFSAGTGATVGLLFPESDASTIQQLISSMESNIGFDQLSQMRQASTTGGALGNVTELQLKQLQSVLGRMDVRGRPEMLEDNVKRVHNIYMDIVHGTPEQIRKIAELREIPLEEVEPLMYRHPLSFDEFGNPIEPRETQAPTGQTERGQEQPQSTRRWNPETGRLE